jgi:hypothetical protein
LYFGAVDVVVPPVVLVVGVMDPPVDCCVVLVDPVAPGCVPLGPSPVRRRAP